MNIGITFFKNQTLRALCINSFHELSAAANFAFSSGAVLVENAALRLSQSLWQLLQVSKHSEATSNNLLQRETRDLRCEA